MPACIRIDESIKVIRKNVPVYKLTVHLNETIN